MKKIDTLLLLLGLLVWGASSPVVSAEPVPDSFAQQYYAANRINWVNGTSLPRKYYDLAQYYIENKEKFNRNALVKMRYAMIDLNGDARPELILHDQNWENMYCTAMGCELRIFQEEKGGKMTLIFNGFVDNMKLTRNKTQRYTDLIARGRYPLYLIWDGDEARYVSKYELDPEKVY